MKYLDLCQKELGINEQVHVWYRGVWCGRFKKGKVPTKNEVVRLVSEHNGFYICEVIQSFECDWNFNFKIKSVK